MVNNPGIVFALLTIAIVIWLGLSSIADAIREQTMWFYDDEMREWKHAQKFKYKRNVE